MDIILLERVEKLGHIGDIVSVKTGYARNYLLPQGKALRANKANKEKFEAERAQIEAENAKRREEAEGHAKNMGDVSIVLIRQSSSAGSLYGSVSSRNIADALTEAGHAVTRQQVVLDQPIKVLGIETVKVSLHPEVVIEVKVNVARSPEEAELQAQGVDVIADMHADEEEPAEEAAEAALEEGEAADVEATGDGAAEGETTGSEPAGEDDLTR